jgi:hypothetical protein
MKNTLTKIFIFLFAFHFFGQRLFAQESALSEHETSTGEVGTGRIDGILSVVPGLISGYNAGFPTLDLSECNPDFSESGEISINMCPPESACNECYNSAKEKMDFFRRQLARLNCIYQNTNTFTNSAVAFGDGASTVHAMTALAWQKSRAEILANFETLKGTYDRKYIEFLEGLRAALLEFDACENQYGTGNWYAKTGFIYFDMMKERYKRMK